MVVVIYSFPAIQGSGLSSSIYNIKHATQAKRWWIRNWVDILTTMTDRQTFHNVLLYINIFHPLELFPSKIKCKSTSRLYKQICEHENFHPLAFLLLSLPKHKEGEQKRREQWLGIIGGTGPNKNLKYIRMYCDINLTFTFYITLKI